MTRLQDKIAIITGGAGGIGIATAALFAREGARVLLVDLDGAALEKAAQTVIDLTDGAAGSDAISTCTADVSRAEQVENYVATAVQRYGGIDILINNAGIEGLVSPITEYSIDVFDQVMAVNVRGVWLGLKYAIPRIAERGGGSIVITSSVAGVKGTAGISAYTASKHAVVGIMRSAALECAELNIRVNSVNPSPVETRMMASLEQQSEPDDPEHARAQRMKRLPLKRYASTEEVARIMLFLASDESSYCTGSVYMIDGGMCTG